jgi:hypothetical protein
MGKIKLAYQITDKGKCRLAEREYRHFRADLLGLGNISAGQTTEALVAIFDLGGFTSFCDQRDPHLAVPDFLEKFFAWKTRVSGRDFPILPSSWGEK